VHRGTLYLMNRRMSLNVIAAIASAPTQGRTAVMTEVNCACASVTISETSIGVAEARPVSAASVATVRREVLALWFFTILFWFWFLPFVKITPGRSGFRSLSGLLKWSSFFWGKLWTHEGLKGEGEALEYQTTPTRSGMLRTFPVALPARYPVAKALQGRAAQQGDSRGAISRRFLVQDTPTSFTVVGQCLPLFLSAI